VKNKGISRVDLAAENVSAVSLSVYEMREELAVSL
jgi:hypothetical protein